MKRSWRDEIDVEFLLAYGAVVVVGVAVAIVTVLDHRGGRCVRDHLEPMYLPQPDGNVQVLYTRVCDEWERSDD